MPPPQTPSKVIKIEGVGYRVVPPGVDINKFIADMQAQQGAAQTARQGKPTDQPTGNPVFDLNPTQMNLQKGSVEANGLGSGLGQIAGTGLALGSAFIPGTSPLAAIARMLGGAAGGAVRGASREGTVDGALNDAAFEGALGGIPMLGNSIARGGFRAGMALGGVKGDTKPVVDALMRENNLVDGPAKGLGPVSGLGLGANKKTGARIRQASQDLEKVETTAPGKVKLIDTAGWENKERTSKSGDRIPGLQEKAVDSRNPIDLQRRLSKTAQEQVDQQAVARYAEKNAVGQGKYNGGFSKVLDRNNPNPRLRKAQTQLLDNLINETELDTRQVGNMKRQAAKEGREIFDSAQRGGSTNAVADNLDGAGAAAYSQHLRDLQLEANPPDVRRRLEGINHRLSDLYSIEEANKALRGGGGVMTDLGQMGMRGGLASGATGNVTSMLGGGNSPLRGAMGLLGMATLAPSVISHVGIRAGQAAKALPVPVRLAELASEIGDLFETSNVKRRTPSFNGK